MVPAALITAVYDKYDTLKPFPPQAGVVDAVCVTDDPDLACEGWRVVYEPRPGIHPNRAAKRPKMLPHEYTDAPASVWIDASFQITSSEFVAEALWYTDATSPVGQFPHPDRDCLFDEAEVCYPLRKYAGEPMAEQVARYTDMPRHWGLWATGVIARHHTDAVAAWGADWLAENEAWSFQDQLSHPYVCWRHNLRPVSFPGSYLYSPWLMFRGSARH